jgi:hypothetical protein
MSHGARMAFGFRKRGTTCRGISTPPIRACSTAGTGWSRATALTPDWPRAHLVATEGDCIDIVLGHGQTWYEQTNARPDFELAVSFEV